MMLHNRLVSGFVSLIFFASFMRFICGNELHFVEDKNMTNEELIKSHIDDMNERLEFIEFCKSANLDVLIVTDEESYSVMVSLKVSHSKFKDCFKYYNVTLQKQRKIISYAELRYRSDKLGVSHEFKNVACGLYEIIIHPCYSDWQCAPFIIKYPELINMTSFECIGAVIINKLIPEQQFENQIIAIIAVTVILIVLVVSGLMFCYYKSEYGGRTDTTVKEDKFIGIEEDKFIGNEDSVFPESRFQLLFVYNFGKNLMNRWKIQTCIEFFEQTGYFDNIKTIADELSSFLMNPEKHISDLLKKVVENGSLLKIIFFVTDEDEEDESHKLENKIVSRFIAEVRNNRETFLQCYDHFFVVKLGSSVSCPVGLEDIVRRSRFTFSGRLMEDHLIDLCLSICSVSNLNMSSVERNLRKLLAEHPVRYFESMV